MKRWWRLLLVGVVLVCATLGLAAAAPSGHAAPDFPTITLVKVVVNDPNGVGRAKPSNFTLSATSPLFSFSGRGGSAQITNVDVPAGTYQLRESGDATTQGYTPSVWVCIGTFTATTDNSITIGPEQNAICTITNTFTGIPTPTPTPTTPTPTPTPTSSAPTPTPTLSASTAPSSSVAPVAPSSDQSSLVPVVV